MPRKILKWSLITIGALSIIVIAFYAIVYFNTESRINKIYRVKLGELVIPTDSASYFRGEHIAINRGCKGCHGDNLASGEVFMDPKSPLGVLYAKNITSGKGGIHFTNADWLRVLRHGLDSNYKSLWFMPSHEVYHISNQDMADLICYLKQQPPVDKEMPAHSIKPLGRILTFLNQFPLLPAEMIDHNAVYKDTVPATLTADYGGYLATTCKGCHGSDFKGSPSHNDKDPAIPDISSTGHPGKWTANDFLTVLHTGRTPEKRQLSDAMPYKLFKFTDKELNSIYLYLHQLK